MTPNSKKLTKHYGIQFLNQKKCLKRPIKCISTQHRLLQLQGTITYQQEQQQRSYKYPTPALQRICNPLHVHVVVDEVQCLAT